MRLATVFLALWAISNAQAETPLYWALANNDVIEVWHANEFPDLLEENGLTVPAWAVSRGNAEAVDALVWRGVALNQIDSRGRNLLFPAAALGRLDLFEKIMAQGAKIDQVDAQGQTLIHAAATSPHPEMLRVLLALGLGASEKSALGVTPLMMACGAGRWVNAKLLLDWGAVPEDRDFLGRGVRDYAVEGGDQQTLQLIDTTLTPWTIGPVGGAPLP